MTNTQRKALESLFYSLARKCESMREWDEMLRTIEANERQHRKGGFSQKYSQPVSVAVCYFACRYVLEGVTMPESWSMLSSMRTELILGQGLRERASSLSDLESVWKDLALDYSTDIV